VTLFKASRNLSGAFNEFRLQRRSEVRAEEVMRSIAAKIIRDSLPFRVYNKSLFQKIFDMISTRKPVTIPKSDERTLLKALGLLYAFEESADWALLSSFRDG